MEQFGFDQLTSDDQLLVLKYMPIKERVRFERVNTEWAKLLNRLWLSQKQLQFGRTEVNQITKCHSIHVNEKCELNYMPTEVMFKIISRCKNLKTLALDAHTRLFERLSMATKLANDLNENCEELEHLDIPHVNVAFFELFKPTDKFTCLVHSTYERLRLLYSSESAVGPLPMKLVNVLGPECCPLSWNLINKVTVERLNTVHWEDKYNELINLKSLDVDMVTMPGQMGTFKQLEHVKLRSATKNDLCLIFKNSPKLVSLKLSFPAEESETNELMNLMPEIFKFGSNLKVLELNQPKVLAIGDYVFWQNLAMLTKLRTLDIQTLCYGSNSQPELYSNLNVNGLIVWLKKCSKIKFVDIKWSLNGKDLTTEAEKEQIQKVVADKSFRQSFVVTFNDCIKYRSVKVCVGQQSV